MRKHLLIVEKYGELPHYRLLDCDENTLQEKIEHYQGSYPAVDGYQIKVMAPDSYTQPLGAELSH